MRKAGDFIREYLRERKLAANRSEPIASGFYGVVYESDVPGNVMKQAIVPDLPVTGGLTLEQQVNLQAIAAEMGIAPRVAGLEIFPGGIGNRIEMADTRKNFSKHDSNNGLFPAGRDAVRVNQQLGQLALKGIDLDDRTIENVVYNKMTGRPMQIDFGIAGKVEGPQQVASLTYATADGFEAAGLGDVAEIYRDTVFDLLENGDVADAMDVAKQGFSRLQKL